MKLKKEYLPYYITISICFIASILLLIFKLYYSSLFFVLGVIPAFFTPLFFPSNKSNNDRMKHYLLLMFLRIFFLAAFSVIYALLWYYIKGFNSNVHPLFLLTFPLTSLIYYVLIIIRQVQLAKKDEL